ncbi:DUF2267 domain-containing protein [Micromonospora sp. NPDC051196]|uniref:DUF2267 domain-containing protein n=1 Tax=Micromonospora sp. NPDC051196 TaxID=3155281 RepID=UPI0034294820
MRFPLFVDAVSRRSGLSPDLSASMARAVLRTLAERMTDEPTTDPTGYLPDELSEPFTAGPGDFLSRVGERAGVDERTAGLGAAAVFATLREAVTVDEFRALVAGLPTGGDGIIDPTTGPDETWP